MTPTIDTTSEADLLERLARHDTLKGAPPEELLWLVRHGEPRRYRTGEAIAGKGMEVSDLVILLTGRIGVYLDSGTGRRHVLESVAGEVSGMLPYSRLGRAPGDVIAEEPLEVLAVHRDHFPEMISACPTLTATLVHEMIDRAREFASTSFQDEKMVSLGRLAAGIAHELNNPASAAMRSAQLIGSAVREVEDAAYSLGCADLSETQRDRIVHVHDASLTRPSDMSALEMSDREERLGAWLEAHGVDTALSGALTDSGVTTSHLDELAESLPGGILPAAVRWIASACAVSGLASDIERCTRRIHNLVSAVARFTSMDRAVISEPTNVAQGLTDTVAVLGDRARAKAATVRLDLAPALPPVSGRAGDLNQVWSSLLDNALDAVASDGEVVVRAELVNEHVSVRVVDNGHGIPPEIQSRIFDPFFTTKPIGEGIGLGLDTVRRIIRAHSGQIAVESRPGRTEFRVTLPVGGRSASGSA